MFSAFKDILQKNFVKIIAHFLIVVFVVGIIPFNAFKGTAKAQNLVETNGKKNKPKEVIGLRTETTKTYDNGDGTYTDEIFSKPIHFKENGKWIDIDSNIKESDSSTYENKSNKFKVKFSRKSKSIELTSFLINGKKLSYSLIDLPSLGKKIYTSANDVTPTIEENKITYKEIFDGVDIRQTVVDDGVKEDIILKKYNGKNSFAFKIKMAGADVVKEADGSVSIYSNNNNEKVFTLPKPYMVDSNIEVGSGEPQRSDNVQYEIEKHGANIYIKVIADDNWLKSSDRKFPVYIDPSTNININGDAYVSSAYPGNNYNADWNSSDGYYQLKTGYYDSTTGTNYSYLKFDLSSLKGKLITSAALKIYCEHSYYASTANAVWLDTVNATWNPGTITWNNKPASTAYTSTNAVRNSWVSFDVTKAVAGWVSVPPKGTNYGFKLHENGNGQTYWKNLEAQATQTAIHI